MSLRYENDRRSSSPSANNYSYSSTSYLPLNSSDLGYLNYTLLESAAAVDPSLTSFHLTDSSSSSSSSSGIYVDRYSCLQSPVKRRWTDII